MPTRHQGPRAEVRALDAFVKLTRAAETVAARLERALAGEKLTSAQLGVLEALRHLGPLPICTLGRKVLRSNPNTTAVVDHLERAGLVRRERQAEDRRVVEVSLTPKGRARIDAVFPAHARRITALLGALSATEQAALGRLCRKVGLRAARA